jgi:hypothetical protein
MHNFVSPFCRVGDTIFDSTAESAKAAGKILFSASITAESAEPFSSLSPSRRKLLENLPLLFFHNRVVKAIGATLANSALGFWTVCMLKLALLIMTWLN